MKENVTIDCVTYGIGAFDKDKFEPANHWPGDMKPTGGLWSSPVEGDGWAEWCRGENFRIEKLESSSFKFRFAGNVLKIETVKDIIDLDRNPLCDMWVNFHSVLKDYDGIWLTDNGQWETRFSRPSLYGWDCETLFVINSESITLI